MKTVSAIPPSRFLSLVLFFVSFLEQQQFNQTASWDLFEKQHDAAQMKKGGRQKHCPSCVHLATEI
jgi:cytochrome c-type biogenesis protein CcmH/NrfF